MMNEKDLGPLPKVHPRHSIVETAKRELDGFIQDWYQKHELTLAEQLAIQADLLSHTMWLTVRIERREK